MDKNQSILRFNNRYVKVFLLDNLYGYVHLYVIWICPPRSLRDSHFQGDPRGWQLTILSVE